MAKTVCVLSFEDVNTVANTSYFCPLGTGKLLAGTVEGNRQNRIRTAGVISQLYVNITGNTATGVSDVTVRLNGADTNLSVTIPAGTTGIFEDTTNTVTLDGDDLVGYEIFNGAGGVLTLQVISTLFNATTNTVTQLVTTHEAALSLAGTTRYSPVAGGSNGFSVSDSGVQFETRIAGTWKYYATYLSSNTRTTTTTLTVMKNGAASAMGRSVPGSGTGWQEDSAETLTADVGDTFSSRIVTGTGSNPFTMTITKLEFETTTNLGIIIAGWVGPLNLSPSQTKYVCIGGSYNNSGSHTTESKFQLPLRETFVLSQLGVKVEVNSLTASCDVRLRKNGANGNQIVTIPSGTTGQFEDTTNTDTVNATDLVNYMAVTQAGGTSISLMHFSVVTEPNPLRNLERTISETITISDISPTRLRGRNKAFTETITLGESHVRLRGKNKEFTDNVGPIADSNNRFRGLNKAFTDNVGPIADTNSRSRGKWRTITENVGPIAETISRLTTRIRTITENITIGESHTRLRGLNKGFTDNVGPITDTNSRFRGFVKTITENAATFAETITKDTSKVRLFSENIGISASDPVKSTERLRGFTENIGISDSHTRLRGFVKIFTDNIGPIDSSHVRIKGLLRTFTENVGPIASDHTRFRVMLIRLITENVGPIASDHVRIRDKLKGFTENILIEDYHSRLRNKLKDFTENITITDNHTRFRGFVKTITDNVGPIASTHTRITNRIRTFTENITITSDHQRFRTKLPRIFTENIGPINSTVIYSIVRSFYIKLLRIKSNKNNI